MTLSTRNLSILPDPLRLTALMRSLAMLDAIIDPALVASFYAHTPLTEDLVRRLNPEADFSALREEAREIGCPATD